MCMWIFWIFFSHRNSSYCGCDDFKEKLRDRTTVSCLHYVKQSRMIQAQRKKNLFYQCLDVLTHNRKCIIKNLSHHTIQSESLSVGRISCWTSHSNKNESSFFRDKEDSTVHKDCSELLRLPTSPKAVENHITSSMEMPYGHYLFSHRNACSKWPGVFSVP